MEINTDLRQPMESREALNTPFLRWFVLFKVLHLKVAHMYWLEKLKSIRKSSISEVPLGYKISSKWPTP